MTCGRWLVEELPPATSHVLLLDEGRAAATGTPAEVLRDDTLSRVYKCPVEVRLAGGRRSRWRLRTHAKPDAR